MSLDFEDALARSRPEPAFSNGEEGHAWESNWCGRCMRDAPFRSGIAPTGCPLLLIALMDRTPAEWFEQPWGQIKGRSVGETAPSLGDTYHCSEFRAPGSGGGAPKPRPEPRQDGLFPRPERHARMLVQPAQEVEPVPSRRLFVHALSSDEAYCIATARGWAVVESDEVSVQTLATAGGVL